MNLPPLLVTAFRPHEAGAVLLVDFTRDTYEVLLPYYGPIHAAADRLYVARVEGEKTRLELYDREGLHWLRRLSNCVDTHSVVAAGAEVAVCSTGTNEILILDSEGRERRRWSPDPDAEADSWHLNSVAWHDGRLFATCFGRFREFRGWAGRLEGAGLLLDVESGQAVVGDLAAPHDPRRTDGGWFVNDSHRGRTLFCPDTGTVRTVAESAGFSRGLCVLPKALVVGFSSPRGRERQAGCASVVVFDPQDRRVLKTLNLPYPEIGHIVPAPDAEVLTGVRHAVPGSPCGLQPDQHVIPTAGRAGQLDIVGSWRPAHADTFEITLRVTHRGTAPWSSQNRRPIHVALQVLDQAANVVVPEGPRLRLPVPVLPGRRLTFPVAVDAALYRRIADAVALRFTLVQETVEWWGPTDLWRPAVIRLPWR